MSSSSSDPSSLLARLRTLVRHSVTARDLQQLLDIPAAERAEFRRQLAALVAAGDLQQRGRRYSLTSGDHLVGRLQGHARGFAFLIPEDSSESAGDVFVGPEQLQGALHGDRVIVHVDRRHHDGRRDGHVTKILERRHDTLVGRFARDEHGRGTVTPFDTKVQTEVLISRGGEAAAESGQMVLVEVTRWGAAGRPPVGRVTEVLGDIDAPGVDTEIILRKHGIPQAHASDAVAQAAALGTVVDESHTRGRTDFRDLQVVTIDGEDARDFDDAISLTTLANGHFWLGVHIADVAHYVRADSPLDVDARARGTSVYFPERAVHMFPESLATGLCSLRPAVDRLVQSCLMEINARGDVVRYQLHDGVIKSDARMTYTEVNAILVEHDRDTTARYRHLVPLFEHMQRLFGVLNERRRRRGAVDFDLPEAKVLLGDDGLIEDIVAHERNVAHRLIEEFMLLANETVAHHLERHEMPALFRIHEPPDPMKVIEFEDFVSSLQHTLGVPSGRAVRPADFQRLVDAIRDTPEERPIAFLMLRTMQKARYDAINRGHFGLAADSYTHFTSPIRRYPDLVVHRLLREQRTTHVTDERREELADELPELGIQTSALEVRAAEAEREIIQWKKVRFMADKVGETFDGYITGVTTFGLFIELAEHFVEGLVHVSTMADDYYRFDEHSHRLRGERTRKQYRLGDRVSVQVVRVDDSRRQIELALTDILEALGDPRQPRATARSAALRKTDERKGTPEERRKITQAAKRRTQRPGKRERLAKSSGSK